MRVKVTKCYLVQVLDEEGNELKCEYIFGDRTAANETGKRLKEEIKDEEEN